MELLSRQKPSKSSFCERILRVVPNESPIGVDSENIKLHPIPAVFPPNSAGFVNFLRFFSENA